MTDNYQLCRYLFIVLKKVSPLMQTMDMTRRIFIFQCCGRKFLIPRDARGFHISRRKLSRCDGERRNFSFYINCQKHSKQHRKTRVLCQHSDFWVSHIRNIVQTLFLACLALVQRFPSPSRSILSGDVTLNALASRNNEALRTRQILGEDLLISRF